MQKKIPMRMCTGCRERKPKRELIRVVRDPDGDISIDLRGKKSGRGAYVCKKLECFLKAKNSRAIEKALDCTIDEEIFERLEYEIDLVEEDE